MQRPNQRLNIRTAAFPLLVAASLTGCAPDQEDPVDATYTVEQARQEPIDVVTETIGLLPAESWSARSGGPWPNKCELDGDDDAVSYSFRLYSEQPSEDLHADVQLVADHWESLGMDVGIIAEDVASPRVYATGGPVQRASFHTQAPGSTSYRIGATSWCAPGNSLELKAKENELREQRDIIPGDDYFLNGPETDEAG